MKYGSAPWGGIRRGGQSAAARWAALLPALCSMALAAPELAVGRLRLPGAAWMALGVRLLLELLLVSPLHVRRAGYFYAPHRQGDAPEASGVGWGRAVGWRLGLWLRQAGWAVLCLLPGVMCLGWAGYLRTGGEAGWRLIGAVAAGAGLLPVGVAVMQLRMLRYLPAVYLLEASGGVNAAFRRARRLTRRQSGTLLRLYARWLPGGLLCLLILPWWWLGGAFQAEKAALVWQLEQACGEQRVKLKTLAKGRGKVYGQAG